ncbi:MAG: ATP-binding protein [Flavobacteriales bacterium]|nr:MAG: ATP-binding protein [Flavobacteriales bacterium]
MGIPLVKVFVKEGTNKEYEQKMAEMLLQFKAEGINSIIFGDIFLEDLRAYREKNLEPIGMQGVFPIWKQNTSVLIHEFLSHGFKTITCCVNDGYLGKSHVGKIIDEKFITELPENVDPCGENGEFHTFVFEGPLFKNPIKIEAGEKVYKPLEIKTLDSNHPTALTKTETKGFWYCDIQDARKTPHKPAFSIYN